jgi:hypothetical protein
VFERDRNRGLIRRVGTLAREQTLANAQEA